MTEKCSCGDHEIPERMVDDPMMYDLADLFKMFADSTRIRIMLALESGEIVVCQLAQMLGMSVSAVSHQLRSLKQAKLIKSRRDGKNVYYSLDDDHVKDLLDIAMEHMNEVR